MFTQLGHLVFGFGFMALCAVMFIAVGSNSRNLAPDVKDYIEHQQQVRVYKITHVHN